MHKQERGYITVYLSLMTGILILLFTVILSGIRQQTIRFSAECVMDMGLNSIFAEYHRALFERYGLLFIDSSYGTSQASEKKTGQQLLHYMNINFDSDRNGMLGKSIVNLRADNCDVLGASYASDGNGEVLRYQISQLMKNKMLIDHFDDSSAEVDMDDLINGYDDCVARRDSAGEQIDAIVDELNSNLAEEEEPYSVSNPADAVEHLGNDSVLFYAIGDSIDMPMSYINQNDYISRRGYVSGAGLRDSQRSSLVSDKALLIAYLNRVCGYYGNEREDSRLQFQLEYIIANEDSDKENLSEVAKYIFMSRYPINMAYLLTSPAKKAEAEVMAMAAASAILSPELTEAITYSILFAWGYAESAKDVRMVFDGHSIPMVKTDVSWNTPLSQMVNFKSYLSVYNVTGGQLDYKKYLRGLLVMKNLDDLSLRLMDIMEMDIRKTNGNADFECNNLIYQLTADVNLSSGYGGGYRIKHFYSYE